MVSSKQSYDKYKKKKKPVAVCCHARLNISLLEPWVKFDNMDIAYQLESTDFGIYILEKIWNWIFMWSSEALIEQNTYIMSLKERNEPACSRDCFANSHAHLKFDVIFWVGMHSVKRGLCKKSVV